MRGVSFLIPVHNAGPGLIDTLRSVLAQIDPGRPHEVVIVDDDSTDGSVATARLAFPEAPLVVVRGSGAGAAAALNRGLAVVRHQLVAQVDQDVVLRPGWLDRLLACADAVDGAAVQGQYVTDPGAGFFARLMGRDLEERYVAVGDTTTHVCTGNALYRTAALRHVGGFDETLGYGYDNDMSYRLRAAGYRLAYCARACSTHRWRNGLLGYMRQQYGFGYGRLDLVRKHPRRITGDAVSPLPMMLHPVVAALACAMVLGALAGVEPTRFPAIAAGLVGALVVERAIAGVRAAWRFGDWVPLAFPLVHLIRDLTWVVAMGAWTLRRVAGVAADPVHSMRRAAGDGGRFRGRAIHPAGPNRPRQ